MGGTTLELVRGTDGENLLGLAAQNPTEVRSTLVDRKNYYSTDIVRMPESVN